MIRDPSTLKPREARDAKVCTPETFPGTLPKEEE
jgi:hypothetical protein